MKILIIIVIIIGAIVHFTNKIDEDQKIVFQKKMEVIDKELDKKSAIGTQVNAACRAATERVVNDNGARVLDWLGGRTATGELNGGFEFFSETSTGYEKRILARVSGSSQTFTADCFTDKSFRVIDLQTFWQS